MFSQLPPGGDYFFTVVTGGRFVEVGDVYLQVVWGITFLSLLDGTTFLHLPVFSQLPLGRDFFLTLTYV